MTNTTTTSITKKDDVTTMTTTHITERMEGTNDEDQHRIPDHRDLLKRERGD